MFRPGLVSITFRDLEPGEIIQRAADSQLQGIEWGGDVHVPPGETEHARRVGEMTRAAGLEVAAYGTYYRLGVSDPEQWARIIETAEALQTQVLRVWCGDRASAEADLAYRRRVADDALRVSQAAADAGMTVACEWHGNTLTDTATSSQLLFDEVSHPAFRTYWQPHVGMTPVQCLVDMETALPRLTGLHVFQWHPDTRARLPLSDGDRIWPAYLRKALIRPAHAGTEPMYALLEFVPDDDPDLLPREAQTLRNWLAEVGEDSQSQDGDHPNA